MKFKSIVIFKPAEFKRPQINWKKFEVFIIKFKKKILKNLIYSSKNGRSSTQWARWINGER